MERLTNTAWRNFDPWECCGQDHYCTRGCHDDGGCNNGCIVPKLYGRLAAYEDSGLEPEEIIGLKNTCDQLNGINDSLFRANQEMGKDLAEWKKAHDEGRMVLLPVKTKETVYVVGEKRIVECFIAEAYIDDAMGLEYMVSFDCDDDCDGCPFDSWRQDYSGEYSCDGSYGEGCILGSGFGKTFFLTREGAEAALAGKGGEG